VIHFRIASVGGVCQQLRHPFPITLKAGLEPRGRAKAVLFQNGTWVGWRDAVDFAVREGRRQPVGEMSVTGGEFIPQNGRFGNGSGFLWLMAP